MYIVEKDTVIETSSIPMNNLSHLMHTGSIGNLVDTDRHKFETFADALWWGIVSSLDLRMLLNTDMSFFSLSLSLSDHAVHGIRFVERSLDLSTRFR